VVAHASQDPPLKTALAIFVKTPGLSAIKTRLARTLGGAAAGEFYRLSVNAIAAVARASVAAGVELTPYWAVAEHAALAHPDWREFPTVWQGPDELGDRLEHVHNALRTRHAQVLLIGADAPQICSTDLAAAIAALRNPATPFVLGRARDGGFWLLGSRAQVPRQIWQAVDYSAASTAAELSDALGELGNIAYLSQLTDVDTADDLPWLLRELAALTAPLADQRAMHAWIETLPAPSHRPSR
jgi:rSAM/selenodomain-associated transferase 1